jgi:MoaA/NifB/PqqE/SkfB family radical SAM enzyme
VFSKLSRLSLARAVLLKDSPIYVQFYVTARCNLTCQQCNIIYANSDVRECSLDEVKRVADNFARMGVAIVLITGGEPFVRHDLPEIIQAFESRGVHVRMQTNGLATEEQIHRAIEYGGKDISISLDSLRPGTQDHINGRFQRSWERAVQTMATFTRYLPKESSFASLGCVLQRDNLDDVESVIRFGTAIGWLTSLVPIHTTAHVKPMGFRTFDTTLAFRPDEVPRVEAVIEKVRSMRKAGFLLYDSDQYLDDIKRFVRGEETTWRSRHGGVCDSPNLYFALLPNGEFAPCCDHRLGSSYPAYAEDFPETFRSRRFRGEARAVVAACDGCMYGSYPEMTISMRFLSATLDRVKLFLTAPPPKPWPVSHERMLGLAESLRPPVPDARRSLSVLS